MKKIFFVFIFFILVNIAKSQTSTVIIYSQTGENFSVYLNNILQNDTAKANVTAANLTLTVYSLKIQFEDIYIEPIERTLYLNPASVSTYMIKKKANGTYKLWPISQTSTSPVVSNGGNTNNNNENQNNNGNNNGSQNNNGNNNGNQNNDGNVSLWGGAITFDLSALVNPSNYLDNGFTNGNKPSTCSANIDNNNFESIKQSINSKSFDSDKLALAKQIAGSNCFKATQVRDIMQLFFSESNKLEFAKYAYHHTSDIANYSVVNEALTFNSSKEELNNYINSLH